MPTRGERSAIGLDEQSLPSLYTPELTNQTAEFWLGGAVGELRCLRCEQCGYYIHPPLPRCPKCASRSVTWSRLSGRGELYSFTINHHPWQPGIAVPYVIGLVELVEQQGLRLMTNIVGVTIDSVRIGLAVRVTFERRRDVWLPMFTTDAA